MVGDLEFSGVIEEERIGVDGLLDMEGEWLDFVWEEVFGAATAEEVYGGIGGLFQGEAIFGVKVFEGDLGSLLPEVGIWGGVGEGEATEAGDTGEGFLFTVAPMAEINEGLLGMEEFGDGAAQSCILLRVELWGHGIGSG